MSFDLVLFSYNIDEMSQELNCCILQLAYGKIGFIIHPFT